uniref:MyD88-4 n=1 Tax=Mizuhopecten yessoensis TaxID=6573 RepID=A0A0H3Y7K7_MIZYE|nr:MyD88-4 [Mizuhopecten yessoensis]
MVDGYHLPDNVSAVSLRALGASTRQLLAIYLDPPSCTVNNDGFATDASGLAELAGFDYPTIRYFESKSSKTSELLDMWRYRQNGTLGNLVGYLLQIERFDCLTEIWQKLLTDANKWAKRSRTRESSCTAVSFNGNVPSTESSSDDVTSSTDFLTIDDVNAGEIQMYSACVCCADDDLGLARDIVRELSKTIKLFIPQDHLVGGAYEFEATAEVIEDRCDGRLVVLLSNHYTNSPACSFATQFAKTLDPDARRRRIIPVVTQEGVSFPRILRGISTIKHYRCASMTSFLTQVIASLSYKPQPKSDTKMLNDPPRENKTISTSSSWSSVEYPRRSSGISTSSSVIALDCDRRSSFAVDKRNSNVSMASIISNESRISNYRSYLSSSNDPGLVSSAIHLGRESPSCSSKVLNINPFPLNLYKNEQSQEPGGNLTKSSAYSSTSTSDKNFNRSKYNDLSPGSDVMARQVQQRPNRICPTSDLNIGIDQIGDKTQNDVKTKSTIIATLKRVFTRSPSNKNVEKTYNLTTNTRSCDGSSASNVSQRSAFKCEGSSVPTESHVPLLSSNMPSNAKKVAPLAQANKKRNIDESDVVFV